MFVKNFDRGDILLHLLYVDDMLIIGPDRIKIKNLKKALNWTFSMKDLGPARQILGMHIIWDQTKKLLWLSEEKYVTKVLQRFNMSDVKMVRSTLPANYKLLEKQSPKTKKEKSEMMKIPYSFAVGSLMYTMLCTRPDIGYAVGVVNRFLRNPGKDHSAAVKWILQYLKGTTSMCLRFSSGKPLLEGFTNSNM